MGGNGWKFFLFNWVIFRFQLLILKSVLCLMKPVDESGLGSTQQYFSCILQSHSSPFLYFFVLFLYFPVFAQISKRKENKGVYTPELTNMTGWKITMFNRKYTSSFMVGFPLPAM